MRSTIRGFYDSIRSKNACLYSHIELNLGQILMNGNGHESRRIKDDDTSNLERLAW